MSCLDNKMSEILVVPKTGDMTVHAYINPDHSAEIHAYTNPDQWTCKSTAKNKKYVHVHTYIQKYIRTYVHALLAVIRIQHTRTHTHACQINSQPQRRFILPTSVTYICHIVSFCTIVTGETAQRHGDKEKDACLRRHVGSSTHQT